MSNMVVNTNVLALNAHRAMKNVGTRQFRASQRLASGLRINSAADDAAGLGISEKMRAQIRGLDQASRNAQDGISLIQTAEGAMQTVNEMVIRTRELVVQASNDTNVHDALNVAQSDRVRIQDEINQLMEEINATAHRTEFNTKTLLDGSLAAREQFVVNTAFVLGLGRSNQWQVDVGGGTIHALQDGHRFMIDVASSDAAIAASLDTWANAQTDLTGAPIVGGLADWITEFASGVLPTFAHDSAALFAAGGAGGTETLRSALDAAILASVHLDFVTFNNLEEALGAMDLSVILTHADLIPALDTWTTGTAAYAASLAGLTFAEWRTAFVGPTARTTFASLDDAFRAGVFDPALNTLAPEALYQENVGPDTSRPLYFQIGPNAGQGATLRIGGVSTWHLGITGISVLAATGADINNLLTNLDTALAHVTSQRSALGAMQNRLEFTMRNVDISSENLSAAESRIRDADMAREMMDLTKANVLQQAATSMLAQANQAPMTILQLLR